jgi:hypothetical protein
MVTIEIIDLPACKWLAALVPTVWLTDYSPVGSAHPGEGEGREAERGERGREKAGKPGMKLDENEDRSKNEWRRGQTVKMEIM